MESEVGHGEAEVGYREPVLEAVRLIKERGYRMPRARRISVCIRSQLRSWVKALVDDPQHAFPGRGQMKPEQFGDRAALLEV